VPFVQRLHTGLPPGIRLGYEGRWKMLSYKMKNYALLTYEGTPTPKAPPLCRARPSLSVSASCSRSLPYSQEDIQGLHDLYMTAYTRIVQHDWQVEILPGLKH
jgi:hypothetical protein